MDKNTQPTRPRIKTIHLGRYSSCFTVIPNALLRESRLSFRARGLLAFALSHSDTWQFTKTWLLSQCKEGREALSSALKELQELGYADYVRMRVGGNGKFVSGTWRFYSSPKLRSHHGESLEWHEDFINRYLNPSFTGNILRFEDISIPDEDWAASRIRELPYMEFLRTPYWRAIAEEVKRRSGFKCSKCSSTERLEAHHYSYRHHGYEHSEEGMSDLISLCSNCHATLHGKLP